MKPSVWLLWGYTSKWRLDMAERIYPRPILLFFRLDNNWHNSGNKIKNMVLALSPKLRLKLDNNKLQNRRTKQHLSLLSGAFCWMALIPLHPPLFVGVGFPIPPNDVKIIQNSGGLEYGKAKISNSQPGRCSRTPCQSQALAWRWQWAMSGVLWPGGRNQMAWMPKQDHARFAAPNHTIYTIAAAIYHCAVSLTPHRLNFPRDGPDAGSFPRSSNES